MKKKILLAITLSFVMIFNVFSACSFTATDTQKYYNTVVAKVGDSEITKYELISSYNNYGYQYVTTSGYTTEEAVEMVLEQLINREVLAKYIEDNFYELFGYNKLENWEVSTIWKDVFEYVNENELLDYINKLRKSQNLDEISVDSDSSTTEETSAYFRSEYTSKYRVYFDVDGKIVKITKTPTTHDTSLNLDIDDFAFEYYGSSGELNKKINKLAQTQLMNYLRNNNKDKSLKTEEEIFKAHLNELYKSLRNTYLITKYQDSYSDNKEIPVASVVEKYKQFIKVDNMKYSGESNKEKYISAVQSNASSVYYHPYQDELIYVSHILVKYDHENTDYNLRQVYSDQYKDGEISLEQYTRYSTDEYLASQCKVYEIVDGAFEDEPNGMNAYELYNMIDAQLDAINNPEKRLDAFIDLAYKYNQDTAMFSSDDFYTVQLDTAYSDTMVKEFADLSRKLYNEQGAGSYGMCVTDYGVHIVYVVGVVGNRLVNSASDAVLDSITIDQMYNTVIRSNRYRMNTEPATEENAENRVYERTLLDAFAEKVELSDYETYVSKKLNDIKNGMKKDIIVYKSNYKDLIKNS